MKGQIFEINLDGVKKEDEIGVSTQEDLAEILKVCQDIDSDEEILCGTSFDHFASKMTNLTPDGKIKKRIRREGVGELPPDRSVCSILYTAFLEFNDEPLDYAHIKKPYSFRLGSAVLYGLNLAVASMKVTEKAQFLIDPDYAFGKMGCPPRIPPNSTILYQIELVKFSDSGAALDFENLTIEDKKSFTVASKTALGLIESAKEHFKKNVKVAIRDYNRALGLIDDCQLADYSEQEEQQKIKLRILTNLTVCYNKVDQPKRCCTACNEIFNMVKNTSLQIPAKVYFNNGRALYMIGEYERAKYELLRAQKLEPANTEISKELLKVKEKIDKMKQKEKEVAKKFLETKDEATTSAASKEVEVESNEDSSFKDLIVSVCDDLLKSNEQQYVLPSGLMAKEIEMIKTECMKKGLKFRESKYNENGKLTYYIAKM